MGFNVQPVSKAKGKFIYFRTPMNGTKWGKEGERKKANKRQKDQMGIYFSSFSLETRGKIHKGEPSSH